jgi:ABC-type transporter Mla subunit MlaD
MTRAIRVGIFVVLSLLILAGAVFLIGDRKFRFRDTYRLNAQFATAAGLNAGAEVRVGGIQEGT